MVKLRSRDLSAARIARRRRANAADRTRYLRSRPASALDADDRTMASAAREEVRDEQLVRDEPSWLRTLDD
jgi:hypothetical protein